MIARLAALLALLTLPLAAAGARAQCPDWIAGPLDHFTAPNGTDGWVYASMMWDPDDAGPQAARLVIAGSFAHVEGVPATCIAMRDPSTGAWQAMGPGVPGGVHALAVYSGHLIAAGGGDNNPATTDNNIVLWDGSSWQNSFAGGTSTGTVHALAVHNGQLYAGGDFNIQPAFPVPADDFARWNPDTGLWEAVGGPTGSVNTAVMAFAQYGGDLIAGGRFASPSQCMARWNGSAWSAMSTGMVGCAIAGCQPGVVNTLAVYNGTLYAGGAFETADGNTTGGFAAWNGSGWNSVGGYFNGAIYALAVHNGLLAIGGQFPGFNGSPNLALWNGASYSTPSFGGTDDRVLTLVSAGGQLVAGGIFTTAGGSALANYIAQWDGTMWMGLGGGSTGQVRAMASYIGRLIVAGDFHQSAEPLAPVHDITGWDGNRLYRYGSGMDNLVTALKSFKYAGPFGDYELIAGGLFGQAGGVAANRIARWDEDPIEIFPPPAWQPMGAGFNGTVYAIERYAGNTYAGGQFSSTGGTPISRIARWNEATDLWEPLGSGMNGTVYVLKDYGGYLYAGGTFTTAGGVSTGGFARWNGSSWSQVGGFFGGNVYALEVHNGSLVMAGLFAGFGSSPNLSSWNGSSYTNFGTGGTNAEVFSLLSSGGRLYIGGAFTTAGNVSAMRSAYWDGATWNAMGGGADNTVYALASFGGEVHAGGYLTNVDSPALLSPRWGRFAPTGLASLAGQPGSRNANPGDDVSFTVTPAAGYAGLSYQWYRFATPLANGPTGHGSTIAGATSATLAIDDVAVLDAGEYHCGVINGCGTVNSAVATLTVGGVTGVPVAAAVERNVFEALGPNPGRGASVLTFTLARASDVRVRVHDVSGRRVREIAIGRLPAGRHEASWDARDEVGRAVRAGVYFVALETDGRLVGSRRVALLE